MKIGKFFVMLFLFGVILFGMVIYPMLAPYIIVWHSDIDIHTGKIRHTRYLFSIFAKKSLEETTLSNHLSLQDKNALTEWRRFHTYSPGSSKDVCYDYSGTEFTIKKLERIWQMWGNTPLEIKRKMVRDILLIWQCTERNTIVHKYLDNFPSKLDKPTLTQIIKVKICETKAKGKVTEYTIRYPNGKLMEQYCAYLGKNGQKVRHGKYMGWYINGQKRFEKDYQHGKMDGKFLEWNEGGKITSFSIYKSDRLIK